MDARRSTPVSAAALLVGALATIALGTRAPPAHRPAVPHERARPSRAAPAGPIDLNAADLDAIEALPRVGPALAARIVAHREAIGGFRAVEDLDAVKGVGPALLERLRPLVRVAPVQNRSTSQPTRNPTPNVNRPGIASSRNE